MSKPNILIFMTDHQRGDTAYPDHPSITPNLDKLAREGISFNRTYCPAPHCCPSRATFFTGLYPSRHGVWNNMNNEMALSKGLNEEIKLWSDDLLEAGYDLHWSGKWHVSAEETPADRGWNTHYVNCTGKDHHGPRWCDYVERAKQPEKTVADKGEILRPGYGPTTIYGEAEDGNGADDNATVAAVKQLEELVKTDGKPWCLYAGMVGPHDPYIIPQRYLDMYKLEDVELPKNFHDEMADKPYIYKRMRDVIGRQFTEDDYREAIRHFWAYCTYLDDQFGKLLEILDKSGQAENTIVLYCADHGDYVGEHGLFAKGIPCFHGAYHVPAVVRWPKGIKNGGRTVDELVSLADFAPTFIEAAGLATDRYFTGASLIPFFSESTPENWRDTLFTQCNGVELYYTQRSVWTKEFKYTFNGFDRDELYDLRNDPDEMVNQIENPEYKEQMEDLVGRMWRFAIQEEDLITNDYITVALAPYGPAEAVRRS